jgi:hypothetical protein
MSKCSSSSTFPKSQPWQSLSTYGTPFHALSTTSNYQLIFQFWVKFRLKKLFDLKFEITIPDYYFGFSKLIFQFRKLLLESKNGYFNFESENWHLNSEFFNLNSKTYIIKKMIFEFWIVFLEFKINSSIFKIIDWVLRLFSTSVIHNESLL